MSFANFHISIKVILVNDKNEFLILKAHDNGPMAGYYDLPGGRIDHHEVGVPFTEIASREIIEECGIVECKIDKKPAIALSWLWPNGQAMSFIYYLANYKSGEIKISDEHTGEKWIPFDRNLIHEHLTTYHKAALMEFIDNQ